MIAIYVRVSTNYQKINGFSIIQQIQKIQNYINLAFPGIESVIYEDGGYSGTTLNRPALQRLLNDISLLKISHVIYTSTDRLSRDIVDYDTLLTYFLLHKTTFICIDAPIETTNATQMLKSKIDVMFAEYEAQRISERTVEGIKGALRKGRYPFGGSKPPYGYRKRNGVLKIHRDESREIKKLFKRFAETSISMTELISHYSIHPDINFPATSIPKMLKNHIYCGFVVFHGEVFPLNNTQIISQALFAKVQEKMSLRSKKRLYRYFFKQKLICEHCQTQLTCVCTKKKEKPYLYYMCANKQCKCYTKRINQNRVFDLFRDELNDILKQQQQTVFKNDSEYIKSKQSIRKINAQINLYKKQKDELFTFLLNHTITKNDFVKQNKRLDNNLEYYENELQLFHSSFHTTFETIDIMNEQELEKFIREYMPRRSLKL